MLTRSPIPTKVADPFYGTPEWRALRLACLQRDRFRCAIPGCEVRASVADHLVSRRDGGIDRLDNLRSLCRTHDNQLKELPVGRRKRPSGG